MNSRALPTNSTPLPLKALGLICVFIFISFGVLAIQYGFAIASGADQWANQLIYWLVQYDVAPEPGLPAVEKVLSSYQASLGTMMTHMIVGGLVVSLGLLQFVPSLRRKFLVLHRVNGAVMMLGMIGVSVSAIVYLKSTTMQDSVAGNAFYLSLWGLAVLSLIFLGQSILALISKDFRGHMLWMAIAFACFLTAPWLRVNYLAIGTFDSMTINRLVANSVGSSLAITLILAMIWFVHVGDRDLPYRGDRKAYKLPQKWVLIFAALSALFCVVGAVMVFTGSLEHLELRTQNLGFYLVAWAVVKVWQSRESVQCWSDGLLGHKPHQAYTLASLGSVVLTLSLTQFIDRSSFQGHALFYGLIHYVVIEILLLVLALSSSAISTGRHVFALCSASHVWVAAFMPLQMLLGMQQGLQGDEAIYSALGRLVALTLVLGICVGTVAQLRLLPSRTKKPIDKFVY